MNKLSKVGLAKAIFLMGTTASNKTKLAINLRKFLPVELISVDSALIYRGMDIGTAKPNKEELKEAPHRLLDILDPSQVYSVAKFYNDAIKEMHKITENGRIPLLVGGTMLYFKTLLKGLTPLPSSNLEIRKKIEQQAIKYGLNALHQKLMKIDSTSAKKINPNDFKRISRALEVFLISNKTLTELTQTSKNILPYDVYQFAITPISRELLHQRIEQRFYKMLALGFEEEVKKLFTRVDLHVNMPSVNCVGYKQMWSYLKGKISYDEMIYRSICATRQLAKHQITWLRKWEKIHWLDSEKLCHSLMCILKTVDII